MPALAVIAGDLFNKLLGFFINNENSGTLRKPMDIQKWEVGTGRVSQVIGWLFIGAMLWGLGEAGAQATPEQIAKGKLVYEEHKCGLCHQIQGQGGTIASDLSTVGDKREASWLLAFMKQPKAVMPKANMMPFKGTTEELDALVAYLSSLK